MSSPNRLQSLDILRLAAVLMVMGAHSFPLFYWHYGPLAFVSAAFLRYGGYLGVDLFFVLSGFLVSGLIFKEIQRTGEVKIGRFYTRRGFKIYPAFYALVIASPLLTHPGTNYLPEIFFVQNYFRGVWGHTWSLAVEEHFYLMLPLLIVLVKPHRIPLVFLIVGPVTLLVRAIWGVGSFSPEHYFQTHYRLDGLLFGVMLSYYFHFGSLEIIKNRKAVLLAFVALLGIAYVPISVGHTLAYVGFGILMINFLEFEMKGFEFLAFLGKHSYSIYLWHEAVRITVGQFFPSHDGDGNLLTNLIWIPLAFAWGILMAKLIEFPMLKLRDRFFSKKPGPRLTEAEAPA